ncbi:MAG: M42 family peptidase [Bacillota bacterium]|nr:MAG: M42 family peptidase [Bacillota bacterium]
MSFPKERLELLRRLSEAPGISGYEDEVRRVVREEVKGLAEVSTDKLGSLICMKKGSSAEPRIMLAGHMDEIGFIVVSVTKEGFLKFLPIGGWWEQVMLAQRVVVKTKKGDVYGVVGSKPPHILSDDERNKVVKKKDMFIDIGAADEREATEDLGVTPGDQIVPESPFRVMGSGKLVMGKAWDDRVGIALFIEVMRELRGTAHPNTIYGVATVQEEVGLRGAETSVDLVEPHVGFALEVDIPGDTPGVSESEATVKLGKGPSILIKDASMIPNRRLCEFVAQTAKEEKLPFQYSAMDRGGTDAGRIHMHAAGVPSLVISVPTRYIHSHTSILNLEDYDNAVKLVTAVVKRLDARTVGSLTDF